MLLYHKMTQTTAEDLPRIIIKPHEGIDELIREAKQEQNAKALIGSRVKSYLDRKSFKSKVDETQMKAPEIVEKYIVYPTRRTKCNIATPNRNGDGTGQLVLQQVV